MGGILIEDAHRFTYISYAIHPDVCSRFLMNMNAPISRLDRYQNIGAFKFPIGHVCVRKGKVPCAGFPGQWVLVIFSFLFRRLTCAIAVWGFILVFILATISLQACSGWMHFAGMWLPWHMARICLLDYFLGLVPALQLLRVKSKPRYVTTHIFNVRRQVDACNDRHFRSNF